MKKMLLFQIGTWPFGIDLRRVKSIQSVKPIISEWAADSNQLRQAFDDEQGSLYDLVTIFEKESANRDLQNEKMIMVETEGQSMAMIVSRVDQVVTVDSDMIEPLSPIFKGAAMSCYPNLLKHEDMLILLLAPEGVEKVVQATDNAQYATDSSKCTDGSTDDEEIVTLVNEVSAVSDSSPISLVGRWTQDTKNCETFHAEARPEIRPRIEDAGMVDMFPELIDAVEMEDGLQCESTSFLANLLQTSKEDSPQADPTDSE